MIIRIPTQRKRINAPAVIAFVAVAAGLLLGYLVA